MAGEMDCLGGSVGFKEGLLGSFGGGGGILGGPG